MCGIAGMLNFDKSNVVDSHKLRRMTDSIIHRGPDGEGFFINGNIGLGHRRLVIIDSETGSQPMFNDDKSIVLVFNGEIYNYIELKNELIRKGHRFHTSSDTEVIIRSYEEWGIDCQKKFNGMWAFALWDNRKETLFLSRDRIGEKPLFFYHDETSFVFASEMKAIFAYGIEKSKRLELIEVYLVMTNIPGPDTFYKNIYKLKPGHFITISNKIISETKYWDLPSLDENEMLRDRSKIYEEYSYLFQDSVKIRMRSDVPFGAFLSGGLDSSTIVAAMSKISSGLVNTFTIGFPDKVFDESFLAQLVADKFKTNHHLGSVNPASVWEALERCFKSFDEPFGDSSAIATYEVAKYAKEYVKMVLTGDGGDELLSGYSSYQGIKFSDLYNSFPSSLKNTFLKSAYFCSGLARGKNKYKWNRVVNVLETASIPLADRMILKRCYAPFLEILNLTNNMKDVIHVTDYFEQIFSTIPYQDDFYKLMYLNIKYDLPDDYLVKVDRMTMANSLESRAPFLDYRLIEFMVKVDKREKLLGWKRKAILKNTTGKKLPYRVKVAKKKGFGVPLREWFKDDTIDVNAKLTNLSRLLDLKTINKIVTDNKNGTRDSGNFIWTLSVLDRFLVDC